MRRGQPIVGNDGEDAVSGEVVSEVDVKHAVSVFVAADETAARDVDQHMIRCCGRLIDIELLARIGPIGLVRRYLHAASSLGDQRRIKRPCRFQNILIEIRSHGGDLAPQVGQLAL